MNKNRYRIIFSKAKNMFIAVAENIKSQSKATGQSTHSMPITESIDSKSFHQLWQVKSIVASMSLFIAFSPVYAQMQADPNAAASQRAIIGVGQNQQGQNVPLVNIQTPKNGVSHNVYNQFDVLQPGVVLNNSRNGAGSVIVGQVGANPYLQTGEARVILNEVNSTAASRFEGNLEVAGQRADVIIANPSGINIQGGGFINANKAIFTTGKPQLNEDGSIKQFVIDQGKINVSSNGNNLGLGGNNNNADYVDIYAKAVELNAQVHANQALQVVTGSNTISDDLSAITPNQENSTTPTFALDVKALGGMYANNIYIIGTDKGLGVSNAGTIQSPQSLVITSAGKIENTGAIQNTNPQDSLLSISTGDGADIVSSGSMITNGNLFLESGQNITLDKARLEKHGADNQNIISVSAKGDVSLQNSTNVQNFGEGAGVYLGAQNLLIGGNTNISGSGEISLISRNDLNIQNSSNVSSIGNLAIEAKNNLNIENSNLSANKGDLNLISLGLNDNSLLNINNAKLYSDNNFNLNSANNIKLNSSINQNTAKDINIYANKNIDISKGAILKTNNNINIHSNQGAIDALSLNAESVNGEISILASKDVKLASEQLITPYGSNENKITTKTNITANRTITIGSQNDGLLTIGAADIKSTLGGINLVAGNGVSISGHLDQRAHADEVSEINIPTSLEAQSIVINNQKNNISLENLGLKTTLGGIHLQSEGGIDTTSTSLNTLGNIELFTKENLVLNKTNLTSTQHTALNSKKNIIFNGQASDNDSAIFDASNTSQMDSNGILSVKADKNIHAQNLKLKGGAVLIEAGESFNAPQSIELNATGNDLLRNDPKLNSTDGDLTIQTKNTLTLDSKIHKLNAYGDIDLRAKGGDLIFTGIGGGMGNGSEQVVKLSTETGGISLEGKNVKLQGTQLSAVKDISIVSTDGDLYIDGVKNTLQGKSTSSHIQGLNNQKSYLDNKQSEIRLNKEYVDTVNKKNELEIKRRDLAQAVYSALNAYEMKYSDGNWPNYNSSIFDMSTASLIYDDEGRPRISFMYSSDGQQTHKGIEPDAVASIADLANYSSYGFQVESLDKTISKYDAQVAKLEGEKQYIQGTINFLNSNINGYEHAGSKLTSNLGNINLVSAKGISISGSDIDAKNGVVNIEAAGTLNEVDHKIQGQYKSEAPTSVKQGLIKGSIIIDGLQDSYEIGQVSDDNYNWRSPVNITTINGDKGVKIRATGKTATDNLILQGVGVTSNNGDVNIEAYKNIIFDVAIENGYDKSKTTETKRKWYGKKKTTTTVKTAEQSGGMSVDIDAKNINIKSQEINTPEMIGQNRTSIDLYSSQLTANGGKINIQAGGDLNFLTIDDVSLNTLDISKKSSFIGIKLNDSKTTNTRNIISELPAVLEANYIGTKAGFDTLLVGTVFNYLEGANIESGGTITLESASTTVEETLKKESSSVVWQSMQDKGSITETGKLPSFNGSTAPTFTAGGGLTVQVPVVSGQNNDVQAEIIRLSNEPGNEYLKDIVARNDVNWEAVKLAQESWNYKSQGLTGAGAAIIVIIVTVLTSGAAAGAASGISGLTSGTLGAGAGATLGAGAGAAVSTIASQASISLINNGGDIGKTLKDLGSKESVKGLVASVVTAGLLKQVGTTLGLKPESTLFPDRLMNNFTNAVGSTLVQTAINGGDLQDNLEKALLAGLAGALQGEFASQIGGSGLDKVDPSTFEYVLHKIAHAAAGCAAAAATKASCEAGAIGAGVGEIVAGLMIPEGKTALDLTDDERTRIKDTSKIIAGTTAAFAGYDVNTAANSANIAVENNSLGKLATSGGKIAYKIAKNIKDMQGKGQKVTSNDVIELFKKEGVQEIVDIGDNIATLINPAASLGDKAFAAIDLVIGIDLKAGKNIDTLKSDRLILNKNLNGIPTSGGAKGLVGVDFEIYLKALYGGKGSFKQNGREFDGAIGNRWYEAKSGNYWNDITSKTDGLNKFKSDMGARQSIAKVNNASYELHSNVAIPQNIKDWLTQKGIKFYEH